MNCGCPDCRLHDAAHDALGKSVVPADPSVRDEVICILEGRAQNLESGARSALDFAAADDRFAVERNDDGFAERAAMFRGLAFRDRDLAHAVRETIRLYPRSAA